MNYSIDIINVKHKQIIPAFEKNASADTKNLYAEVTDVMNTIYNEHPDYFPYGLHIPGHDSVYAVRDNATEKIAGFVGWQEHLDHDGKRIGSYSIGILPEYRGHGLAKEAVAKIIQEKVNGVDRVVSYIVPDNKPSQELAKSLDINVRHDF